MYIICKETGTDIENGRREYRGGCSKKNDDLRCNPGNISPYRNHATKIIRIVVGKRD